MRKVFVYSPVKRVRGLRGLHNFRNTCYINAVVQCLLSIPMLDSAVQCITDVQVIGAALKVLMDDMSSSLDYSVYTPDFFVNTVMREWRVKNEATGELIVRSVNQQQDAHELLLFLLDRIHSECNVRKSVCQSRLTLDATVQAAALDSWARAEKSIVADMFHIQLVTSVCCTEKDCNYHSNVCPDPETVLTLYLTSDKRCLLLDCIKDLCGEVIIADYKCEYCKGAGCVKRTINFGRLPPVLIIQLSRFKKYGPDTFKNNADVEFSHVLDFEKFTVPDLQTNMRYELLAVTNHLGNSMHSGHYTAYVRRQDRWFNLDDSQVSNTTAGRVLTGCGYLLWYQLKVVGHGTMPMDGDTIDLVQHHVFPNHGHPPPEVPSKQANQSASARSAGDSYQTMPSVTVPDGDGIPSCSFPKSIDDASSRNGSFSEAHPVDTSGPVDFTDSFIPASNTSAKFFPCPAPFGNGTPSQIASPFKIIGGDSSTSVATFGDTGPISSTTCDPVSSCSLLPTEYISTVKHTFISVNRDCNRGENFKSPAMPWKHVRMDLDKEDPILTELDVAGAFIENVENAKVSELEQWLRARRLPIHGNKKELTKRVQNHMARGKSRKIDPGTHGGRDHKRKRVEAMQSVTVGADGLPFIPTAKSAWKPFPSHHFPEGYKYFNILEYYEEIPAVAYSYTEGVKELSQRIPVLHDNSDSEVDCDEIDEDFVSPDDPKPSDNYTYLCRRATVKCLDKGECFLNSGRVLTVMDSQRDKQYFIKAQVQASMENTMYTVVINIECTTGKICDTSCRCKTHAMKRCGHIAAVLLLVWRHVTMEGYEAITTTGRPCYWRKVPPGKNPSIVSTKQYQRLRDVTRRNIRDPRPSQYSSDAPMSVEKVQNLRNKLQDKTPTCILLYHLEAYLAEKEDLSGEDFDTPSSDYIEKVTENCSKIMWELARECVTYDSPFEVPNTRDQADNPTWHKERRIISTASDVKQFLGLSTGRAKKNYLRKKLWGLDRYESAAMREGKIMEAAGREAYAEHLRGLHPSYKIVEVGLCKNSKYPQLGCSPDGIIVCSFTPDTILLELKRYTKCQVDPSMFDKELPPKDAKRFYLLRNSDGFLELKKNHAYFYQIQQSLDILEIEWCHLYVFSDSGHVVVPVQRDLAFWNEKRERVIKKHRELLLPEFVMKRTLRHNYPLELSYPRFHEDPKDEYFQINDRTLLPP